MRLWFKQEGNPLFSLGFDNEPVLTGPDSDWMAAVNEPKAEPHRPGEMRTTPWRNGAPYEPTFQQRIERAWGIFDNVP